MNFFGIGLPEMMLIFVVALLIFGPKKLPEIGRSLGKAIRSFQDASKEFENEFKREAEQLEKSVKKPMEAKIEPPQPKALTASQDKSQDEEAVQDADLVESDEISAESDEVAPHSDSQEQVDPPLHAQGSDEQQPEKEVVS